MRMLIDIESQDVVFTTGARRYPHARLLTLSTGLLGYLARLIKNCIEAIFQSSKAEMQIPVVDIEPTDVKTYRFL
jgi:hypothetical protein